MQERVVVASRTLRRSGWGYLEHVITRIFDAMHAIVVVDVFVGFFLLTFDGVFVDVLVDLLQNFVLALHGE